LLLNKKWVVKTINYKLNDNTLIPANKTDTHLGSTINTQSSIHQSEVLRPPLQERRSNGGGQVRQGRRPGDV